MANPTILPPVQPALLFMPDITGFTEFVATTEILHAQHIIQEVLNLLVDANEINMQVEEIEGDAVFFYRFGAPPALPELLRQVEDMFTAFHQHLRQYENQRLCDCGACNSAVKLQLKIFAHFGEVAGYDVREYRKLFGRDVIVLHRLLKNSLTLKEYVLLTEPLVQAAPARGPLPAWFRPQGGEEIYDIGRIRFQVNDLSGLYRALPPVELRPVPATAATTEVLTEETTIPAPAGKVYEAVFEMSRRCHWMADVEHTVPVDKDRINRIGTRYRYESKEGPGPVMVTAAAEVQQKAANLTEMEQNGTEGRRYDVKIVDEHTTRVSISVLVKKSWWRVLLFKLFHRQPLKKRLKASLHELQHQLQK